MKSLPGGRKNRMSARKEVGSNSVRRLSQCGEAEEGEGSLGAAVD